MEKSNKLRFLSKSLGDVQHGLKNRKPLKGWYLQL